MGELARESSPDVRALVLAYIATEGCGCCELMEHGPARRRLCAALGIPVDGIDMPSEGAPAELMAELTADRDREMGAPDG